MCWPQPWVGTVVSDAFEQEDPLWCWGWAHLPQREVMGNHTPLPHAQDRRQCLADALEQLMQTCPADVDHEKTQLLLTMLLAKKIADHSPALLRDVFRTTVTFINQNLLASVRNLVRSVRPSGGRALPWSPSPTRPLPECWGPHCGSHAGRWCGHECLSSLLSLVSETAAAIGS